MRKGFRLNRVTSLALVVALALVALAACGDDDSDTAEQPAAETAQPTAAPEPTATPTPAGPTAPEGLAAECLPGGALENPETIASCAEQALQQVGGFSFEGEFNLLAVFSGLMPEGGGPAAGAEGAIHLSGSIVLPDRMKFDISFGTEGEALEIAVVVIGEDTYFQPPEANFWFKGTPPDSDFLSTVQMVGMLQLPRDTGGMLEEPVELDDGTTGYVLSYDDAGQDAGMEGFELPSGTLLLVVGADDFLTREVRVTLEDASGEAPNLIAITYGYETPAEIEPPAQYLPLPEGAMEEVPPAEVMVVGLARNADGDVEVTFSEAVYVEGQVELYVIDPATGGWGLPLIDGSGTAVLTFDADAEDRPSLVLGESEIAGFVFPTPDSQMTDAEGNRLDLTFDAWTYE